MLLTDKLQGAILQSQSGVRLTDLPFKEVLKMTTIYDILNDLDDSRNAVNPLTYVVLDCAR